jgi:hypothetical protein
MMKAAAELVELRASCAGREDGVPKYLRLRNALAAAIAEGRWKSGARIPDGRNASPKPRDSAWAPCRRRWGACR